ncbi:MAG: glycosyltransferase family 87 protein [Candidatus Dormibacteria bacterium]
MTTREASGPGSSRTASPALSPQLWRRIRLLMLLGAAAASLVAVWSFVVQPLTGHFTGTFEDFSAYLGAARSMAAGGSPYAQFDPGTVVMSGFIYPPFAALVVRPLALLSDRAAMDCWLFLGLACAVTGSVVVARTSLPRSWPAVALGVLAALAFGPATYNYWHGQINPLIFLLLAVAYWAYVRDRQVTAGVLLGLAAGIKIAPLIFLVLLIRRRWWRATAAMVAAGAVSVGLAAVTLGTGPSITFLTQVFPALNRATGWIYNQSLGGAISRLADQSVLHVQPTSVPVQVLSVAAALIVVGLAGWATRAGTRAPEERGAEYGLGITAMLLAGGIAWYPHFMHLLIPLFAVLGLVAARGWREERPVSRAALAALLVFGLVAPAAISGLTMDGIVAVSRTAAWWPFLQLCSLPCLSAAWLAIALALRLGRGPAPAGTPDRVEVAGGVSSLATRGHGSGR